MIQVHTCVRLRCDQCGETLGDPYHDVGSAHYPTESAALRAAREQGWHAGAGEHWWCSACAPILLCEAEGHQFSDWRQPRSQQGVPLGTREYRYCRHCALYDSRPTPAPDTPDEEWASGEGVAA